MLVKEFHYLTSPNAAVVAAFKSSANYYLVVISGREASLVRVSGDLESAEVIKNIEWGPFNYAYAVWNKVGGRSAELIAVGSWLLISQPPSTTFKVFKIIASPSDIGVEEITEVKNAPVAAGSALDTTLTYPRLWAQGGEEYNCVYLVDLAQRNYSKLGCYGPGGHPYNIWPMVIYNGATELGEGRWVLASHHYWLPDKFAYLHIADRYRGAPSKSYASWDSCSGAFSALDRFVGGAWDGAVIGWGRSGGLGRRPCLYVWSKPFAEIRALIPMDKWRGFPKDNLKALIPLYFEGGRLYFAYFWEVAYGGGSYVGLGLLGKDGAESIKQAKLKARASSDHEAAFAAYDVEAKAHVIFYGLSDGSIAALKIDEVGASPVTLARMPPRVYLSNDGVMPYAYGRASSEWCPDLEGQCSAFQSA
nr:MAG: hypothetical protein TU35_03685 [Thermoproteus sp. AZ2]